MSERTLHNEVQRLQCLQALGITVYHPRFRLPGAKPSEQGPWASLDTAPHTSANLMNSTPAAEIARGPRRIDLDMETPALADSTPQAAATRSAVPPAQVSSPRTTESAQIAVQHFQLLFMQIDADLAIVDQIPALARPQLQDKQLALLTNLLRWLGKSVPAQTPRMFRWPLPGLEHMAASMNAQSSLQHFLEQAHSERGFRFLLQLGPQALAPGAPAWQSFATHSLDEMLALPSLKREAWQSLLPLHGVLRAGS